MDEAGKSDSVRELSLGGIRVEGRTLNLADIGFRGGVSEGARAQIRANERRAARVLQTAHLYWFGR